MGLVQQLEPGYQRDETMIHRSIIEQLPEAVIVTDQDGQPVQYNQTAQHLLGEFPIKIQPGEWPRQFSLYLKDGITLYPENNFPLLRALRGESVTAEEILRLDNQTGSGKWMSITAKPLTREDGQQDGALVVFSDITPHKEAQLSHENEASRIEASFALSRQIARIGNDPIKILNTVVEFTATTVGDGCAAALLNRSGKRLKITAFHHQKPEVHVFLHDALISNEYNLEGVVETVISSGEPAVIPVIAPELFKDVTNPEQIRYLDEIGLQSLLAVPIKGRKGVVGSLILLKDRGSEPFTAADQTYVMDIAYRTGLAIDNSALVRSLRAESSVRRSAQEALELSEARFRSIFTSTSLGIKLLDLHGNILETNPAFQNILGYTEEELKGKPISNFWHPADANISMQLLEKLTTDRVQSFQLEHRLMSKDFSIVWFNVTFTGIKKSDKDALPAFIVAIAENITKRKKIEAEMVEMKSRLHHHVEMERLELAQNLHDGPLQELYSAIYKIDKLNDQFEDGIQAKVDILKQDLLKVVHGLRSTAKNLRPPALTNFGLEKAIRSHADDFREVHPEIDIHLSLAPDRQVLPEDIRLILFRIYQHSMMNILRHAKASQVNVRFAFDAEEAQLTVGDNGVGFVVPNNWIELVRQGHYGLAGAVERAALLEGTFSVESAPGEGTTVRVVIPMTDNADAIEKVGKESKHERY